MAEPDPRTATARDDTDADGSIDADLGTALGRYALLERIGAGGMGVVFRARDPELGRELAIKVVIAAGGDAARARLLREAQAMARLRRPGVVPVFDVGSVPGGVFIVMPLLRNGTLGAWLRAAPRPWREVLDRFVAVARGLAAAHASGLIHRDIKPDNILIDDDGAPLIGDFGLARTADATGGADRETPPSPVIDASRPGAAVGTPAYMAPEQLRGEPVDARADVFAFCVSLYEALHGERPFTAEGPDTLRSLLDAIIARRVRPRPSTRRVPAWLRAALIRGLGPDPAERWPSMDALIVHLERRRRRPRRVAIATAAALALSALAVVVLAGRSRTAAPTAYRERRLTSRGDIDAAALSPDGRQLAYVAGGAAFVMDVDGDAEPRRIGPAIDYERISVTWSPEGDRIAYTAASSVGLVQEIADLRTGAVTPAAASARHAVLAPRGGTITWQENERELTIRSGEGVLRTCAVPGDYTFLTGVIVSGDALYVETRRRRTDLVLVTDLACTSFRTLLEHETLSPPVAAPAGQVAVTYPSAGAIEIAVLDRDGHRRDLHLAQPGARLVGLRSDDAPVLIGDDRSWELLRVGADGRATELTAGAMAPTLQLDPAGGRIAMLDTPADGGALRIIPLDQIGHRPPPLERGVLCAAWSLDGTRLAILVGREEEPTLLIEDATGGRRREVPIDDASAQPSLVWVDDHTVAYLISDHTTYRAIDLVTGAQRDVFDRTRGWTFRASRDRVGGDMLLFWNRPEGEGLWQVRADGRADLLRRGRPFLTAWTADGRAALVKAVDDPEVERLDLETRALTHLVTVPAQAHGYDTWFAQLPGGDLLVERVHDVSDVSVEEPVR